MMDVPKSTNVASDSISPNHHATNNETIDHATMIATTIVTTIVTTIATTNAAATTAVTLTDRNSEEGNLPNDRHRLNGPD
jgi:hypothetical protein